MPETPQDGEQFVTFRIPNVEEATAAGLDPEAWDPVLDLGYDQDRLALSLDAELPIRVPTWAELGMKRGTSEVGVYRADGVEAERRRDDTWEVWVRSDDPMFECPSFETEVEARWFIGQLAQLGELEATS